MAAAFAARALATKGRPAVSVQTAGTAGAGARPVTDETAAVLTRRGLDPSGHRSRPLGDCLCPVPDVIVGMAREHARAAVEARPQLFPKTFTLKDLVARATNAGPRRSAEALDAYLARVGAGRGFAVLAGASSADDIADPIGQARAVYERCASEIEPLVTQLVDLLWPTEA
jgi:protein-tyrosine-phosphatase